MPITRQKKEEIVARLTEALKGAASLVFVNFHGLNAGDTFTLRRTLRGEEVSLTVSKKTLMRIALGSVNPKGEMPELAGELAIAYGGTDPLAPARSVYQFQKTHGGMPVITGGIFEGAYQSAAEALTLATIPSREVLLSKLAFMLHSPVQRFAVALGALAEARKGN